MGHMKWEGGVALALADDHDTQVATPDDYIACDSAKIDKNPRIAKRRANAVGLHTHIYTHGFDYEFSVGGITPQPTLLGRAFYAIMGTVAGAAYEHTITFNQTGGGEWVNIYKDDLGVLDGGTDTVENLIGGKLSSLELEFILHDFAKMALGGQGCSWADRAALSPSYPSGANDEPLAWKHLADDSGHFKYQVDGGAVDVVDDEITALKIAINRSLVKGGMDLASQNPTQIESGIPEITFSFTKEFYGANALAQAVRFLAQGEIGIEAKAIIGTSAITITIPHANFTSDPIGEAGATDDLIQLNCECEAFYDGSDEIMTVVVTDSVSGVYTLNAS